MFIVLDYSYGKYPFFPMFSLTHLSTLLVDRFREHRLHAGAAAHLESTCHFDSSSVLVCCKLQVRLCDVRLGGDNFKSTMKWSLSMMVKFRIAVDAQGKARKEKKWGRRIGGMEAAAF